MNRLFQVQSCGRVHPRRRSAHERETARLINVAVILLVTILAWLGSGEWLHVTARPHDASVAVGADGPSLTYMVDVPLDSGDVRIVRSPVLFALPTQVGFSAPMLAERVQSPVPAPLVQPAAFIDPPPVDTVNDFGETQRRLEDLMAGTRALSVPAPDHGPVVLSILPAPSAYRFFWQDQPGETVPGMEIASASKSTNGTPWQAEFLVCFTPYGSVESLMIEKPGPDRGVNLVLSRFAREIIQPARPQEFCRRLIVQFQPVRAAP